MNATVENIKQQTQQNDIILCKKQEKLSRKIKILKNELLLAEAKLLKIQCKRVLSGSFAECKHCYDLIIELKSMRCYSIYCEGGLCNICSHKYLCSKCSNPLCRDCKRTINGTILCEKCV